mmetsp:Transcript_109206/g.211482  ORF Transcript_109206/g.211482 Transcript_109206/m.211482 type:complete len:102 (+) Transcript_109206:543-848(+)
MQRAVASGGVAELAELLLSTCDGVKYVVGTRLRVFIFRGGDADLERDGCVEATGNSIGVVASLLTDDPGPGRHVIGSVCLKIVTREAVSAGAGASLVTFCL